MLNKRVNLGSGMEKGMRNTGKRALHRLGILALERMRARSKSWLFQKQGNLAILFALLDPQASKEKSYLLGVSSKLKIQCV